MKRILATAALTIAFPSFALGQTTDQRARQGQTTARKSTAIGQQSRSDEQEFRRLYDELDQAHMRGDKTVIERTFADDVTVVNSRGTLRGKKDVVSTVRTPSAEFKLVSTTYNDMRARRYGDAAVVTYLFESKRLEQGKEVSRQSRITDVWVRRDGHWQIVAAQVTNIAQ